MPEPNLRTPPGDAGTPCFFSSARNCPYRLGHISQPYCQFQDTGFRFDDFLLVSHTLSVLISISLFQWMLDFIRESGLIPEQFQIQKMVK
jgi:hypothetical protein